MKQVILILISLILLIGCSVYSKSKYEKKFAVKSPKSAYGKKYHFIIESRFKSRSRDISGMFGADKYALQYHFYTNTLGKVSGSQVIFDPSSKNYKAHSLSSNSIFIFNKNEIILKNIQICFDYMTPKCSDSGLNGRYLIKDISLLSKNLNEHDFQGGRLQ